MSVWARMWAVDLLRRRERRAGERAADAAPLLIVREERQRRIVAHCCERAQGAGVRPGMPLAQARALLVDGRARVEPEDAPGNRAALRALAAWARRFSPIVAVDEPDGLLLDVTGCERVFKGERRLLDEARRGLASLGIRSSIAIAPTHACARALARFGASDHQIIGPSGVRAALVPLPVEALRPDERTIEELAEVGVERIGELLEIPRGALAARFGEDLLLRLDRALGQAIEVLDAVRPGAAPAAERVFDGPTDRVEAIEATVRGLLAEIGSELLSRECGARRVQVELTRCDLPPERIEITLGRPSRDVRHLWRLIAPKLERANLGLGVEGVRVRVGAWGRLRHEQIEHGGRDRRAGGAESARAGAELIDTLGNRLGSGSVVRAAVIESHAPERAFAWRPCDAEAHAEHAARPVPRDRPTILFDPPMLAEVIALSPDGPIHRLRWRDGDEQIVSCFGPERLEAEWWRGGFGTRDYFAVQDAGGRWLWVGRSSARGRWFVHGVWA